MFAIGPVRRNAVLGLIVHFRSPDLNLDNLAVGAENSGVQRLIAVGLWHSDVIFNKTGKRFPARVDYAKRSVAILDSGDNDAKRDQVMDFFHVHVVLNEFAPEAVVVLGARVDVMNCGPLFFHLLFYDRAQFFDIFCAFAYLAFGKL